MSQIPQVVLTTIGVHDQLPLNSSSEDSIEEEVQSPTSLTGQTSPKEERKKRTPSRTSLLSGIRRSASTPQIRGSILVETGTISSPADKRRNKLGYQRSSMACGHCRRRKIRCVPPTTEDPQGRCANCIRLKKECVYYPVDHAIDMRTGKRDISSMSSAAGSPRSPVPPGSNDPLPEGHMGAPYEHSHGSSAASLNSAGLSDDDRSLSLPYLQASMAGEPSPFAPSFSFPRPSKGGEWGPSSYPTHPTGSSPYWASADSTPTIPNFPPNVLSSIASSPHLDFQQGNQSWAPSRSASFSDFEGGQPEYSYSGSSLQFPKTGHAVSAPSPSVTPNSAAPPMPVGHGIPFSQPWLQPHEQPGGPPWYAEPGSLAASEVEDPTGTTYANVPHFYGNQHAQ